MPPIKNVLKDAWQSAKQSIPDRQRQQQYEDPTSEYGGSSQVSHGSSQQRGPHNVTFADTVDEPGQQPPTELNPLNPFRNQVSSSNPFGNADMMAKGEYQSYEETGFNYQDGGFPQRWVEDDAKTKLHRFESY